ncbi:hypothetical protein DFH07DRAFT_765035 [Mycena maculata]|uniref:Uncharacterized protein n=1 Tax=Mycena maculata TaxID=230809 RepID=A0AAD7KD15_9AGAR|nr:hypothetical protein DFH07DRAFT_765035 [Mycena maculata]
MVIAALFLPPSRRPRRHSKSPDPDHRLQHGWMGVIVDELEGCNAVWGLTEIDVPMLRVLIRDVVTFDQLITPSKFGSDLRSRSYSHPPLSLEVNNKMSAY